MSSEFTAAAGEKEGDAVTNRERTLAVLNYATYDRLPMVHFGFWEETLEKWQAEGYLSPEEAAGWADGNQYDRIISARLGFDFNWYSCFAANTGLEPPFEERVVERRPDGTRLVINVDGVVVLEKDWRALHPRGSRPPAQGPSQLGGALQATPAVHGDANRA